MDDPKAHDVLSVFGSSTFGKDGSFEVNKPVGSMSISPCGRDVVLASRQGLHVIDLDSPWAPPRHLPHHTPWEVADVQWSPFPSRDYWVVSTSNQKALVWNLAMSDRRASVEHYLHAHSRAITDINFSAHHPDVLATCAIDSFVHCWDLRHPARPAVTFCDWYAGATQVKWNRQDAHVIASAHDKFLRIWDDRKGAYPLRSIEAHDTKIYGLDWNRERQHGLLTCSLDHTIKLWDYRDEADSPQHIIRTPFPVWRARHTPFGSGILAMPQRGDNNLYLYNRRVRGEDGAVSSTPIKSFHGHTDQVKEFLWRYSGSIEDGVDDREFQLVTWGADRILRLHSLDNDDLARVGYEKGREAHKDLNLTRKQAPYRTYREILPQSEAQNEGNGMTLQPRSATLERWAGGEFLTTRSNLRADVSRDMDPITWMKGVKIGKKESGLDQSAASLTARDFREAKEWEEFESLGEEIAHVGTKFSKVEFPEIDVKNRFVKLSMRGLWDTKEASSYLKCRIDFPEFYPAEQAPVLAVERIASLDSTVSEKLQDDARVIGEAYAGFHRSSLEAILRYLQGDLTVGEAISWTKEEQENSIADLVNEGDSSSDEEDEVGGFNESQTDEFGLGGSGMLNTTNPNAYMPLPRMCGAFWAKDGRLVCFFPPKEEKQGCLASTLRFSERDGLAKGRRRLLDGFGKITKNSKSISLVSSMGTLDSSESTSEPDTSESERSESASTRSFRDLSSKELGFPSHVFETEGFGLHFLPSEKPVDETLYSAASASMAKNSLSSAKSIIYIHNFATLLPSKEQLAREYSHFGADSCKKNEQVASAFYQEDLANVWSLLDMLLYNKVSLEVFDSESNTGRSATYAVVQKTRRQRNRSSFLPKRNRDMKNQHACGRVRWAQHPFGASLLIQQLFAHFSRIADVQMLALMSCALGTRGHRDKGILNHVGYLEGKDVIGGTFYAHISKASHFPSSTNASSQGMKQRAREGDIKMPKPIRIYSPLSSPAAGPTSEPDPLNFTSFRGYTDLRTNRWRPDGPDGANMLSGSPELIRPIHKSSTNFASAFAASFSRPFSFSASTSSSPPTAPFLKKRISPLENFPATQGQDVSAEVAMNRQRRQSNKYEARLSRKAVEVGVDRQNNCSKKVSWNSSQPKRVSIRLKNQDQFQLDGFSDSPSLIADVEPYCTGFREGYADMLALWQLPIKRAEVLKHHDWAKTPGMDNGHFSETQEADSLSIGKKSSAQDVPSTNRGVVELSIHCQNCGIAKHPNQGHQRTRCPKCHLGSEPVRCTLCDEAIWGKASPCLKCGHVMHVACRTLLYQEAALLSEGCVTGCGCSCTYFEQANVQWYEKIDQQSLGTQSFIEDKTKAPSTRVGSEMKRRGIEEDLAYESLAKNLGAARKYSIRPSKSHVWRGRERRGASMGTMDEHRDKNFWLGV